MNETQLNDRALGVDVGEPEGNAQGESGTDRERTTNRMLYRHPTNKLLGGVCGGLADYFGWDPTLVRILWVVATLATSGGGFLAYLALWILLPVGTADGGQQQSPALEINQRNLSRMAFVLIGLGIIWLLANLGILPWLWSGFWAAVSVVFWPALLIGAGYVILRYAGKGEWGMDWSQTGSRVRNSVNSRMPSRNDMKDGLRRAQRQFPIKRSRTDRMFMGVCGGLGQRLGIDANLVRLVWAAFSVGSIGMGVLLYIAAGLLLPEEQVTDLDTYTDEEDVKVIDVQAA